jgi:hypothetical protein
MLRESAEILNTDVDLHLVNGEASDNDVVPFSNELMNFATAVATRDEDELTRRRDELASAAGAEVLVDAAAVAGNFQRMVRIADSTGIPVDAMRMPAAQPAIDQLDLRRFPSSEFTPEFQA